MRSGRVITVPDRCAAGIREDMSGPVLVTALEAAGYAVSRAVVLHGEARVRSALLVAVDAGDRLIVTAGGTDVAPHEPTPGDTREVLNRLQPGLPEPLRADGVRYSACAARTRGTAGVVDACTGSVVRWC